MLGFLRSFWGAVFALIALLIILEHAAGFSTVLGSGQRFTTGVVRGFRT